MSNAPEAPFEGAAPGWDEVAARLRRGELVLLLILVPGGLDDARRVSRAVSRSVAETVADAVGQHVDAERLPSTMSLLRMSRSATAGLAAVAASARALAVGVDVERVRLDLVDDDLLSLALHVDERRSQPADVASSFFSLWTRKEAVLKALGTGLARGPNTLNVGWGGDGGRWQAVEASAAQEALHVRSVDAPAGYAAALACIGPVRSVHCRVWAWPAAGG